LRQLAAESEGRDETFADAPERVPTDLQE
jgi:hypothetical protein